MEIMLRCSVPDRPGALRDLAAAIADAGGDIEALSVVEVEGGRALDDLFLRVEPGHARDLVERIEAAGDVELVHLGPSRGHPSDAVTRFAVGIQSLLDGAMTPEHAVSALVSGLLHASAAVVADAADTPPPGPEVLVLPFGRGAVVARRDYRFTATEQERVESILRACLEAMRARRPRPGSGYAPSSHSG